MEDEEIAQFPADSKVIENLLTTLAETEAENFVWDAPSESDLAAAGFFCFLIYKLLRVN